jgi:glycosyltransferase involved in cell wall biosynthesis
LQSLYISVIIPTYNRSELINRAIKSVLNQSRPVDEIIVVDDGSTDETQIVINDFSEHIIYIKTRNKGVSHARNIGILRSSGKFIAFLDSDDSWHPHKIKNQFLSICITGSKVCFSQSIDEFGNILDDLKLMDLSSKNGTFSMFLAGDTRIIRHRRHPYLQSALIDRKILNKNHLFDEKLVVAEDTKLIYNIVLNNDYCVVYIPLTHIFRNRQITGLSDSMNVISAHTRYYCYCNVQMQVLKLISKNEKNTRRIVISNIKYFHMKKSELCCALSMRTDAILFAIKSIGINMDYRSLIKIITIILAYPVAEYLFTRKWTNRSLSRPTSAKYVCSYTITD